MENRIIKVVLLASQTKEGKKFSELVNKDLPIVLSTLGFDMSMSVIYNGQQYDMSKSILENDIVIFDASLENEDNLSLGENYSAATANIISNDNILVVSRTTLPINFIPCRTNVPELGMGEFIENGHLKQNYSNIQILEWIREELYRMKEQRRLPRPKELMMQMPPFEELGCNSLDYLKKNNEIIKENSNFLSKLKNHKYAFISYRSHFYNHQYNGWDVKRLYDYIQSLHPEEKWNTLYYPGGILSQEFMPEFRRWGFSSFVDRKIRSCSEFWIFDTPQDSGYGYWDSWWTQGEIISLMWQKYSGCNLPDIYIFDPRTGTHEKKDASFIPEMSEAMAKELTRYYSNADFISGGIESLKAMRELKKLPPSDREKYIMCLKSFIGDMLVAYDMEDAFTSKSYEESLKSHTYDDSFVEKRIIACPGCQRTGLSIDDIGKEEFIRDYMHINSNNEEEEVEINNRGFFSLTEDKMLKVIEDKEWKCPRCGRIFRIEKDESFKLYLWWSVRCGRYTGPDNCIVEAVPIYKINSFPAQDTL